MDKEIRFFNSLDIKIEIYKEYKKGRSLQDLSKEYEINFSNLRYMVKFIDKYGIEEYMKPNHFSKNKSILIARYFETCIEITNANFLIKKSIILQIENILKVLYVRTYSSDWWS